jgi:YidC/Oxa1 family membrane protein insertase
MQFSSSSVQHRQFRAGPLLSNTTTTSLKEATRLQTSNTIRILRNGTGLRFASTTPSIVAQTSEAASRDVLPSATDLSTSLEGFSSIDPQSITNLPEQIGYLKALGLDYGLGPTSVAQWLLEHIHIYTGTPWWLSIGLTAVLVRVMLLRPYVWAADTSTKMRIIKPLTDPLRAKMMAASQAGDTQLTMEVRNELSRIHKQAGIQVWKGFLAPLSQGLLGFGTFFALRAMSQIPVPGLLDGGALWFHNLAIPDPYFLLPMATAAVGHWMFRVDSVPDIMYGCY